MNTFGQGGIRMQSVMNICLITLVLIMLAIAFPGAGHGEEDKAAPNMENVETGEALYKERGCTACHTIGGGKLAGPDLEGVTDRREREWLRKWIKSPDTMVMTDPIAKELLKEYFVPMPNQGLTEEEVEFIITYLKYEDSKKKESN
jgi:nitrite reductase (NO-forming)